MRLAATGLEADWTRGAVHEIRYQSCPDSGFKSWEGYKQYRKTTETHPVVISFCEYCKGCCAWRLPRLAPQQTPYRVSQRHIGAEENMKRRETKRVHKDFIERLECSLTTGEDMGISFAQITKDMYPEFSMKGTGSGWEQCRRVQT